MNIQVSLFSFVPSLAASGIDQATAIEIILNGFNIELETLQHEMLTITEQAYAGLNNETGNWCKGLLLLTVEKRFS